MTSFTASRTGAGAAAGESSARCSKAFSIVRCRSFIAKLKALMEVSRPLCGFDAFGGGGDQGDAHVVLARVDAPGRARQKAPRQHRHIIFGVEAPGVFG